MIYAIEFLRKIEIRLNKKIYIHFPTNATLLDEKKLHFFESRNVILSISLDTLDLDYHERDFVWNGWVSSTSLLQEKIELFIKFQHILRVKMVIIPERVCNLVEDFFEFYNRWFRFINIQPAHGIFWSDDMRNTFIENMKILKNRTQNIEDLQSVSLKGSSSSTSKMKQCAKWTSEICIDAYGDVYVCDAFLAYDPKIRKQYAHDNINMPNFLSDIFEKWRSWKYCNNQILKNKDGHIEKDLTQCIECNESISCSKLCNAAPINNTPLEMKTIQSNFLLFKELDLL